MADETILLPPPVEPIKLKDALEERYLAYALSTIMHRALPDVRDGLKPVHRRVIYAMRQLKLDPGTGFKKCARVVGDVIGKYHPHGDQSVYDALVRLAQSFAQRYPLVDGQGNFGNIDGDNAAAMRYTEARMTAIAAALLDGIDQDTVDFRETYDGEEEEPVVLPAAFPNLLANGSSGIAVGMATSIPPHNAEEVCDAALYLIKNPRASVATLLELSAGAGFPDGRRTRGRSGRAHRGVQDRARLVPPALALAHRGNRPRHLSDHRHRNPLRRAEVAADREDGRPAASQEAAAARAMWTTNRPRTSASSSSRNRATSIRRC